MKTSIIQFSTKDGLTLPGVLFEPAKKSKRAAIFLHGNGSSSVFYKQEFHDEIGKALVANGISYLPFNNRGAHYIKSFKRKVGGKWKRMNFGSGFELIADCVKDIDASVLYLRSLGYSEYYLLGHSTGANKIALYNYLKPRNPFSKFILLAPGDDTGIYFSMFGPRKFGAMLKMAKDKMKRGQGRTLVSENLLSGTFISYASLFDTINPEGDYNVFPFFEELNSLSLTKKKKLWREYQSIKSPTLVLVSENDEHCFGRVPEISRLLKERSLGEKNFDFHLLKDSDHSFHGKEKVLAKIIASFLAKR